MTAAPAYTRGMLRIGLLLALALGACADGTSRRNIEMVPLPPPSVTPEPSLPEAPTPRTSSVVEPGSALPRELPKPGRGERDAAPPVETASETELESAIVKAGWSVVGSLQTTREGGFEVSTAEIKKPGVRGRVRLVRPHGEPPASARLPYLPADANPGVIVEVAGGRGGEAYFYDRDAQSLGRVELRPPGTRREASSLLRAFFPFVH